jgi:CMP/dCMP kinase
MYRGIAFAYHAAAPEDLERFLSTLQLDFVFDKVTRVFLDAIEITGDIRTPEISLLASSFSQNRLVRSYLTVKQREVGAPGRIVVEGRDTGSVVFPSADLKFYLDADIHERATRRFLEISDKEPDGGFEKVRSEMEKRDRDDSSRDIAPLIRPVDALYVDTTGKNVEEVVAILETEARRRGA